MKKYLILLIIGVVLSCNEGRTVTKKQTQFPVSINTSPEISELDILTHLKFLCHDSLKGRASGTQYERMGADYIANVFYEYQIPPIYDSTYFQNFHTQLRKQVVETKLSFGEYHAVQNKDYIPIFPVDSAETISSVVFISGADIFNKNIENFDVKGKIVMFYENALFNKKRTNYIQTFSKAQKEGASGVISIRGENRYQSKIVRSSYTYYNTKYEVPFLRVSDSLVKDLFETNHLNFDKKISSLRKLKKPFFLELSCPIHMKVVSKAPRKKSQNVIAYIEGNDSILKNKYVVIGAHYDHLGERYWYTDNGKDSAICYGADDNASGTSAVLELAELIKKKYDKQIKRSVIFVGFGVEEIGKKGSEYLIDNFPVPLENVDMMFNFDMIGRLDSLNQLQIHINKKMPHLRTFVKSYAQKDSSLKVSIFDRKKHNTDFIHFKNKDIPSMSFHTGSHIDYHTARDTVGAINLEGEKRIIKFAQRIIIDKLLDKK
jgi:hypothetical protein